MGISSTPRVAFIRQLHFPSGGMGTSSALKDSVKKGQATAMVLSHASCLLRLLPASSKEAFPTASFARNRKCPGGLAEHKCIPFADEEK